MAAVGAPAEAGARLRPDLAAALATVAARPWGHEFYLAGSAALALHLGHRRVGGGDLMSAGNRLRSPERRDLMDDLSDVEPDVRVETARDGFLYLRWPAARAGESPPGPAPAPGPPLRFYYYPYPNVEPPRPLAAAEACSRRDETETGPDGLAVASLADLGLMKLGAIISRGTKRDFVDLHLLARRLPVETLLARSADKFPQVRDFPLQAVKGLADLSLTEGEPMPRLAGAAADLAWEEVAEWARAEARRLGRGRIGL